MPRFQQNTLYEYWTKDFSTAFLPYFSLRTMLILIRNSYVLYQYEPEIFRLYQSSRFVRQIPIERIDGQIGWTCKQGFDAIFF